MSSIITHGDSNRTDIAGASSRVSAVSASIGTTLGSSYDNAKYKKVLTLGAGSHDLTGSRAGNQGFIVASAGTSVLHPLQGDTITASNLTAKTIYEIGLTRVTGSGTVQIIY